MPPYTFSTTSTARLLTCAFDLQRLFREVIRHVDCTILCGHRGKEEQMKAYTTKKSTLPWPHSRHNSMPSQAIDVAPWPLVWTDLHRFKEFAVVVKELGVRMDIPVEWGGDWPNFKDYPHWQLKR
jgi:hypothetical protein